MTTETFVSKTVPTSEVGSFKKRMKQLGFIVVSTRNTADGQVLVTARVDDAFGSRVTSTQSTLVKSA